jgi:hypothetical protein
MAIVEKLVEWRLAGETEVLGENLPHRHFGHHKSHMTRPEKNQHTQHSSIKFSPNGLSPAMHKTGFSFESHPVLASMSTWPSPKSMPMRDADGQSHPDAVIREGWLPEPTKRKHLWIGSGNRKVCWNICELEVSHAAFPATHKTPSLCSQA